MKLKIRLFLGFTAIMLIFVIMLTISMIQLRELNNVMDLIVNNNYKKVQISAEIANDTATCDRNIRELVLIEGDRNIRRKPYIDAINQSKADIYILLSELEFIADDNEELHLASNIRIAFDKYLNYIQHVIDLAQDNKLEQARELIINNPNPRYELSSLVDGELKYYEEKKMNNALNNSMDSLYRSLIIFVIAAGFSVGLGIIIMVLIIRSVTHDLKQVSAAMSEIAAYEDNSNLPRIKVRTNDEIGEICNVFNIMATSLEEHAHNEKVATLALRENAWLNSEIADITALFQGIEDYESFTRSLISRLCMTLDASFGIFYILKTEDDTQQLIGIASYAGENYSDKVKIVYPGEGLVGQCFLEKKTLQLTNIPEEYIHITSGLGSAPPRYIHIMPIEFEESIIAVIELASLAEFSPIEKILLEKIGKDIGIALNRISNHLQVQNLLVESQTLTEELQSQSEELQIQQEELMTSNEKLEEQYKDSEERTRELLATKSALEEQAYQLALSAKYKTEFLSNMSHELRTPLNSLLILAKILAENKEENLTPKQVEYAETIVSSGNDLLELINGILDLSKIESGKSTVKPDCINLGELKVAIERQFNPVALQKGIGFRILIDSQVPTTFCTDNYHLKNILKNLLSNAFKFTQQGYVELHIYPTFKMGTSLAFSVTDTGIGIPKEKQELIFEAFQQADGTTSRKYGGTGLGLSICKQLTSLLGGFIEVDSVEGQGSKFTIYLPEYEIEREILNDNINNLLMDVGKKAETTDQAIQDDSFNYNIEKFQSVSNIKDEQLNGRKVLLVDDDMRNIFAITAVLEKLDMDVKFAENGQQAIEKLQQNPDTELVLMDMMMPEIDGYDAIKAIRNMEQFSELPIIAVTAKAMKDDREKCLQAGASDYISKPIEIEQLISLIRVWLY
ncbi:MAG: response regulator [Syntrophomonadaceae bacterium]